MYQRRSRSGAGGPLVSTFWTSESKETECAGLFRTALTSFGAGERTGESFSVDLILLLPTDAAAVAAAGAAAGAAAAAAAATSSCGLPAISAPRAAGLSPAARMLPGHPPFGPARSLSKSLSMMYSARAYAKNSARITRDHDKHRQPPGSHRRVLRSSCPGARIRQDGPCE